MENKNNYIVVTILIINIIALFLIITNHLETSITKWIFLTLPIFIPIILKELKISINNTIEMMYLILIFLSSTLGRIYRLYYITEWFDLVVHGISGIQLFILGLIILKHYKIKNITFTIIFTISLTLSLGTIRELTEYNMDELFKTDMQNRKTGVKDTMEDLSIAGTTSIISLIIYSKMNKLRK